MTPEDKAPDMPDVNRLEAVREEIRNLRQCNAGMEYTEADFKTLQSLLEEEKSIKRSASTANDLMESWSERDFLLLDNLDMFKSLGNILKICQSMDDLDGENLAKATQIEELCRKAIKGNPND